MTPPRDAQETQERLPAPPPPEGFIAQPRFFTLPVGTELVRIFTTSHETGPLTFRPNGPRERFDHQPPAADGKAYDHPERRVYYAAMTLECCLVEVFTKKLIEVKGRFVAMPRVVRPIQLLDIRGRAAMLAGTQDSLAGVPRRSESQVWARYFYETPHIYSSVDGVAYRNAHNGELAFVLFERSEDALTCTDDDVIPLGHELLAAEIQEAAILNGLIHCP